MHRWKKALIGFAVLLVLFTIAGFFVLPPIVRDVLTDKLSQALHRPVSIQSIKLNPYLLKLTIRGFEVKDQSGKEVFTSFEELSVDLEAASIFRRALIVKELKMKGPKFRVVRNADATYNFSDLITPKAAKKEPSKKTEPLRFSINNIRIERGYIDFQDVPKETRHVLKDILVSVPVVSNMAHQVDRFTQPLFSANINNTLVVLKGKTKPFADSLETIFDLDIKNVNIPYYLAYLPADLNFKVTSGTVDTKLQLNYIQYRDRKPSLVIQGDVDLKQFGLREKKGRPLLKLSELRLVGARLEPLAPAYRFREIVVMKPEVSIERDKQGDWNLLKLLPSKKEKKESPPVFVQVDALRIESGTCGFSDDRPSQPVKLALNKLNLNLKQFSTAKNNQSELNLITDVDETGSLRVAGSLAIDPLAVKLNRLDIKNVNILRYLAYLPADMNFKVTSGTVDTKLQLNYIQYRDRKPSLVIQGDADLKQFNLTEKKGSPLLKLSQLRLVGVQIEPLAPAYRFREIVVVKPEVSIQRDKQGEWNLLKLLPSKKENKEKKESPPVFVQVDALRIESGMCGFSDDRPSRPVKLVLNKLNLNLKQFSTAKNNQSKLNLITDVDKTGSLRVAGPLAIDPVSANLAVKLKSIGVRTFQPYFNDRVKISVTRGDVSAEGKVAVSLKDKKDLAVKYTGKLLIANFHSIDKLHAEDFVSWKSLYFNDVRVVSLPLSIDIRQIALANFYTRIVIDSEGALNLQNILAEEEKPAEVGTTASGVKPAVAKASDRKDSPKPVKIGAITVQGGTIDFLDQYIKPNYAATLAEIGGRISELSSLDEKPAEVELRGKFERFMPLSITGRIHPLRKDLFVDLKASFKDMDLSPTSPYSGKYIGRKIQKGKLSFDLTYLIAQRKLKSENKVFVDQLTLGDKVESPKATKLPVGLAIALLKDRTGRINLNVPVTGSLDDPEFSLGRLILQALVNLLTKAATAPFALLGSLLGGGAELSYVEFDYGQASVPEVGLKNIQTLAQAMQERPALNLDIAGHADLEKDREGVKVYWMARKVKARKLKDMIRRGEQAIPLDEVKIPPEEYEKYLTLAYKNETFPKPRNAIGLIKSLPVSEMEKLILTHTAVRDEDLTHLAAERAREVREALLKSGKVTSDRIFIVEPKTLAPEKKEAIRDSRVDFNLR